MSLIFDNPGTKIDGCYHRDIVLMQEMLPSIHSTAGDAYVFWQDNAPAHRACQTVELFRVKLQNALFQTYGPQTVLILTP